MRQICYRVAASHFQNCGAGLPGLNYFEKHILWHTLLNYTKVVVDATSVLSRCSVPFSKFRCGTNTDEVYDFLISGKVCFSSPAFILCLGRSVVPIVWSSGLRIRKIERKFVNWSPVRCLRVRNVPFHRLLEAEQNHAATNDWTM